MTTAWKLSVAAPRDVAQAALLAHEEVADWDPEVVLSGVEVAEDRPEDWRIDAYLPREPTAEDRAALAALFAGGAPAMDAEPLPDSDWVTLSQEGVEPIRAGRFRVRTPEHPASTEGVLTEFVIPASRAFGTGQHATTAGCLAMLEAMKRRGVIARNLLDVGTGTGLLAFAALALWPRALATASDIDAVCAPVVLENASANAVRVGGGPGALTMVIAAGLDHPLLAARAPYDLVIANILAWPLIELAPAVSRATLPGGHLLLAGLLATQERAVRSAYRRAGFRLAAREQRGDWAILWLRKRGGRA